MTSRGHRLEARLDGSGIGDLERPALLVQDGVSAVCLPDAPEVLEGDVEQTTNDCAVYATMSCDKNAVSLPGLGYEYIVDKVLRTGVDVIEGLSANRRVIEVGMPLVVVGLACPSEPRPVSVAVALEEAVAVLDQPEILVYGNVAIAERELGSHVGTVEWA